MRGRRPDLAVAGHSGTGVSEAALARRDRIDEETAMPAGEGRNLSSLGDVADRVHETTHSGKVSVGEVLDALGPRSFVPLLLAPALLAATPLSGIPGVSIICGLLIALISFEMLMSYDQAYIPGKLRKRTVDGESLRKALEKARPVIDWIDRHTRRRLSGLFHRPMVYIPKLICLFSGLAMPFLEFIPFSSSIVAIGVSFLAISLLTRDGLFFIIALLPYVGVVFLVLGVL
jgi:hypothetical protein